MPSQSITTVHTALALMLSAYALCYPGDCKPSFDYTSSDPPIVSPSCKTEIVTDSAAENWLKFQALATQWRNERGSRSSISETVMMPAYQKIIGMGRTAVPLIIAQLRSEGDEPDQWFWALRAITDENPVQPADQGNFQKMAQAWLEWAENESV
jgi:hypothetical protein